MSQHNWIRHRDPEGNQFDLREDAAVPKGVEPVKDYAIFRGPSGRPGKAAVDLRDESRVGYSSMRKAELLAEVESRDLEVESGAKVADLIAVLEAADAAEDDADQDDTHSSAPTADTGESNKSHDADALGTKE